MSSKEYARRPRLPRPISMSLLTGQGYRRPLHVRIGRHAVRLPCRVRPRCDPGDRSNRRSMTTDELDGRAAARLRHRDHGHRRRQRPHRHRRPGPSRRDRHAHPQLAHQPGHRRSPRPRPRSTASAPSTRARTAAKPKQALEEIATELAQAFRDGVPVVAYNATFDLCLLDAELRRHRLRTLPDRLYNEARPVIDPLVLDRAEDRAPPRQAQAGRPVRVLRGRRVRRAAHRRRRRRRDAGRARAHRRPLPAPGLRWTWTRCTSTSRRRTRRGPRGSTPGASSRGSTAPGSRTCGPRASRSARSGEASVISPLSCAGRISPVWTAFDRRRRGGNISSMS